MKTYMAKPGEVEQKWHVVDATDQIVGRLASRIAVILMGKHRPTYTPHVDTGDFVVVDQCREGAVHRQEVGAERVPLVHRLPGPAIGHGRDAAGAQAGADPARSRAADAAQEQAGVPR